MKTVLTFLCIFISGLSYSQISLVPFATGITGIVDIASAGDERIFLVQKSGIILIADSAGNLNPSPFLDIRGRVYSTTLEPGMLSLVFAPDFKQSGVFYVYYNQVNTHDNLISRFRLTANPDEADSTSEQIIINISTTTTHLGGDMAFGKDGFLYIGLGDGGGEGDPSNHAQDSTLLLGKFLRLDVSNTALAGYSVPPTNPFLGSTFPDEVWSVGFRNPWRWSFDRLTYDMWIGDVGQGSREEVDFAPSWDKGGKNYGWRCYEGNVTYNTVDCSASNLYTAPIYEYPHTSGCSVTGGFVCRGSSYHTLFGQYFYSDWCNTSIRRLIKHGSVISDSSYGSLGISSGPVCFGEDQWGDILVGASSNVYRLIDPGAHHVAWIWDEDTMHVCAQSTALLQTPAGPGFHYQWYRNGILTGTDTNQITATNSAAYFVIVQNANGLPQTSTTVYVLFEPLPNVSIAGLDSVYCLNDAPANFLVNPLGGQLKIDGVNQSVQEFDPGAYGIGFHFLEYSYTTSYGCTNSSLSSVRVDACLSVTNTELDKGVLYPNPAGDYLNMPESGEYLFFDQSGRILKLTTTKTNDKFSVYTKDLAPGIYFCRITSMKTVKTYKWVKE